VKQSTVLPFNSSLRIPGWMRFSVFCTFLLYFSRSILQVGHSADKAVPEHSGTRSKGEQTNKPVYLSTTPLLQGTSKACDDFLYQVELFGVPLFLLQFTAVLWK